MQLPLVIVIVCYGNPFSQKAGINGGPLLHEQYIVHGVVMEAAWYEQDYHLVACESPYTEVHYIYMHCVEWCDYPTNVCMRFSSNGCFLFDTTGPT